MTILYHGGEQAAQRAIKRIGEKGYDLLTNNCEHFASECCGLGKKSAQVSLSSGKLLAGIFAVGAQLLAASGNPCLSFIVGVVGANTYDGGFKGGVSFHV